jgi:hypothetical protein
MKIMDTKGIEREIDLNGIKLLMRQLIQSVRKTPLNGESIMKLGIEVNILIQCCNLADKLPVQIALREGQERVEITREHICIIRPKDKIGFKFNLGIGTRMDLTFYYTDEKGNQVEYDISASMMGAEILQLFMKIVEEYKVPEERLGFLREARQAISATEPADKGEEIGG